MLFEGKVTSQTQNLQAECADWVERSLHLRILGKQLVSPKNEGFQHFESNSDNSVDTKCLPGLRERTGNIKELCISGSKLIPKVSPVQKSPSSGSTMIRGCESSTYSFLEEEIYDADGKMEEYLAFDIKELDDEHLEQKKIHLAEKRRKHGIPPVSPMACIEDAVASEIFDHLWSNVIGILEELIKKHLETNVTESTKQAEKLKAVTGKLPAVRVTADAGSVLLSRGSEARSVSFGSHLASSQVKITSSNLYKPHSISSSAPNSVHTSLGRIADNHVLSSSRVLLASARKLPSHCRLPSLTSDQLSSKAPNMYNDEILRGTKFLDRLSSGSAHTARNKLPPINLEAVKQYTSVIPRLQQRQYARSRVSSAVPGSTEQQPVRERTLTDQFSRPSTTHTFRQAGGSDSYITHECLAVSTPIMNNILYFLGSQHYYKSFHRNPLSSRRRFQITS
uniref:DUF3719 domain-containing protein n=1 Tax=Meleagris gallopavo TaxID=9103 RepID=A0A803YS57_MELGA